MKNKMVRFVGASLLASRRDDRLRLDEFAERDARPFDA